MGNSLIEDSAVLRCRVVLSFSFFCSSFLQLLLLDQRVPHAAPVEIVVVVGTEELEQEVQEEVLVDELEEQPVKQEELQEEVTFPLGASSAIHSGPEPGWTPFARGWLEFEKYKSNKNEIDLEIHP